MTLFDIIEDIKSLEHKLKSSLKRFFCKHEDEYDRQYGVAICKKCGRRKIM